MSGIICVHSLWANLRLKGRIESTGREKWDQSSSQGLSYPGHSEKGTSLGRGTLLPYLVVSLATGNKSIQVEVFGNGCLHIQKLSVGHSHLRI